MYISYDAGAHWQSFQLNLPRVPIMDLKFYRHNLIVATEGRAFWILDDVPVLEGLKDMPDAQSAFLFKPAEGYRTGGGGRGGGGGAVVIPPPTFRYWFKDEPTSPVTVQVMDPSGAVVYTATAQPGTGTEDPPPAVIPDAAMLAAAGGGRGAGPGAGRGAGGFAPAGGAAGQAGGGGGGRGGGRGGGGLAAAAGPSVSAHKGMNTATWTQFTLPSLFSVPQGLVMWGGGGGQGPRVAPGMYTVKVSMGSWSQTQPFHLGGDPRYLPPISDADAAATLKMAMEVGGWNKTFFDNLAKIRDAKKQAADIAAKTPALAGAAKAFTDAAVKVEGDMTQLKGDPQAGQDGLSYSGRLDNQLLTLYSAVNGTERKLGSSVLERYADLKPQYEALMARAATVLKTDVAAFNAAATKAGVTPGIVIK
jgi:hypothetical protein